MIDFKSTSPQTVDLLTETAKGRLVRNRVVLQCIKNRIHFIESPFSLKGEIKSLHGAKWHGYDEEAPVKQWSATNNLRNQIQLRFLAGDESFYQWFDRPIVEHSFRQYERNGKAAKPMSHQVLMANFMLSRRHAITAAVMRAGKTLASQMAIEASDYTHGFWIGPKTSLPNIKREMRMWGLPERVNIEYRTYDSIVKYIREEYKPGDPLPQFVFFDEMSRAKTHTSQRSQACQSLCDLVRDAYGYDSLLIGLSGTPAPKSPVDWWSLLEIIAPGFLKEGTPKALERRLAFFVSETYESGTFQKRKGWKDNPDKCENCGELKELHDGLINCTNFQPSKDEVRYLHERMKGVVLPLLAKDCLDLPERIYRRVMCKPSTSLLRAATAIAKAAPSAMEAATLLRELSSGFQYRDVKDGKRKCTHCKGGKVFEWFDEHNTYQDATLIDKELERREVDCPLCHGTMEVDKIVRETKALPCPKEKALKLDLERCEETQRIVIFGSFHGALDRIRSICIAQGWHVIRCDGNGFEVTDTDWTTITRNGEEALEYWAEHSGKVAFVAHPASGGMSLTLRESRMIVFFDNDFRPENRMQAQARCDNIESNRGVEVVDYIHLPSDLHVLDTVLENRRVELLTLGDLLADRVTETDNVVIDHLD